MPHEDDDVLDLEFEKREPGILPWFKFWAMRWMGSDTITKMSLAHQAIYIRLMCGIHMHGKLSRDAWVLSKRLDIPYRPLLSWMKEYGSMCTILHEEGCTFSTVQPLPFHSTKAAPEQCGDSAQAVPKQCSCSSWTVPNYDKLQVLMGKSTPDVAGDKKRRDKSRGDCCSAPNGAAKRNRTSKHQPDDMVEVTIEGVTQKRRRLRDSGCCGLCDVRNLGDPNPHCARCGGRGNYSTRNGVVPCDCCDDV